MKKRLLEKIIIEDADDELIELAKCIEIPYEDRYLQVMYVAADEIVIDENKILLLHLYPQSHLKEENSKAAYRLFLNQDDYITQELFDANKWKTASLKYLLSDWSWRKSGRLKCLIANEQSKKTIKRYLKTKEDPIDAIFNHQEYIMAKRLENKHKSTIDRIDSEMEKVTELPGDFHSWIDETALFESRYIYYEYKAGKKSLEGYCTHCKTDVKVEGPRHNKLDICPNCKSPITYKAMGKSKNIHDTVSAALLQKIEKGFVIRFFRVYKDYRENYKKPSIEYFELARSFYDKDEIRSYEWGEFKQSGELRWCDDNGKFDFSRGAVYEDTIDESVRDTTYQYSALKELAASKQGFMFDVSRYLSCYKNNRFLEYLVKLKLYILTINLINRYGSDWINAKGKNMLEILKVSKSSIPILQANNSSLEELRLVQTMDNMNIKLSAEQIKYIYNEFGCATSLIETGRYTTINKAIKYIESRSSEDNKADDIYHNWMDYIRFCEELEYDLNNEFVLYPKNLMQEHDRLAELVMAKKDKEKAEKLKLQKEKIAAMSEGLNGEYGMEHKQFMIIAPDNAIAITNEGQALHHCVGTYIERIAEKKSIVLFIRKKDKPNKPYCTLEIIGGKVIQCRGKHNKDMREELRTLLGRFEKLKLAPEIEKEAV